MAEEKEKRSFFESPLFLKILSVFIALILWFFVAGGNEDAFGLEVRRTFDNIPLSIRNMGADLVVAETLDNVTLSLQGVHAAFDGLTPADLEAYVDLNGRKEGWHEVRINAMAPPGVSVVRIDPAKANILLDNIISRQMEVDGNIQGEPAQGRLIIESNFEPGYVFVQGPARKVDQVEKVIFHLELDEAAEDFVAHPVRLFPVDSDMNKVEGLIVVPDEAAVWVRFEMPRQEVPVEVIFLPEEATVDSLSIEPQMIVIQGPQDLLDTIDSVLTDEIDLETLDDPEGQITLLVPLVIPADLQADRDSVRVRFYLTD